MRRGRADRPAFTLIELLIVMGIILLVSVITIPGVVLVLGERGIQAAGQLVQASILSAQAQAAGTGQPAGIRFGLDPTLPGFANRLIPLGPAPDYSEGLLTSTDIAHLPDTFVLPYPCLMVEQTIYRTVGDHQEVAPPTNWAYNVRVGDQLRIGDSGPWMTVVGPTDPAHPTDEKFVTSTQVLDRGDGHGRIDYLWVVNGVDDDHDGFIDSGWDGVDNDADGVTDEFDEWEIEKWQRPVPIVASRYTIRRRAVPSSGTPGSGMRVIELPTSAVIDMKDMPSEFMVDPAGAVSPSGPYGVPSRFGLQKDHEIRIHLTERGTAEHEAWIVLNARTGEVHAEGDIKTP